MIARAYCPGHITGFFEIRRSSDILASGSRGAGACIDLGAVSEVQMDQAGSRSIEVKINGRMREAEVTTRALEHLLGDEDYEVKVKTVLSLPESQGFGMSAAGALSTTVAAAHILGADRQKAFEAAHTAEIECATGLGDVPALHRSGITIRERQGLPPTGKVSRIDERAEIVLAVVGPPIKTAAMLADGDFVKRVNASGSRKVQELLREPTLKNLMRLSGSFTAEARLATERVEDAMKAVSTAGDASMVMLGNSVFAVGDTSELVRILGRFGEVNVCGVDFSGPTVIEGGKSAPHSYRVKS